MAKTLEEWRKSMHMTITELAEKAGLAYHTVWRIESNYEERAVYTATARKIVDALGLASVDDIDWPYGVMAYGEPNKGKYRCRRTSEPVLPYSLRWWREKRGMSMSLLAEKAGVWRNTIWNIECDYKGTAVNEHLARQLVDALGLQDLDDVVWPHGISNRGRAPGANTGGGNHATAVMSKPKTEIVTCSTCFCEIQRSGKCGCY